MFAKAQCKNEQKWSIACNSQVTVKDALKVGHFIILEIEVFRGKVVVIV